MLQSCTSWQFLARLFWRPLNWKGSWDVAVRVCHLRYLHFFLTVHLHVILKGMKLVKWDLVCSISCFSFSPPSVRQQFKKWGSAHPQPLKEMSSLGQKGQNPHLCWFISCCRCSAGFPGALTSESWAQCWSTQTCLMALWSQPPCQTPWSLFLRPTEYF